MEGKYDTKICIKIEIQDQTETKETNKFNNSHMHTQNKLILKIQLSFFWGGFLDRKSVV